MHLSDFATILRFLETQMGAGRRVGLATIVATAGHSPRPLGTHLAVSQDGSWAGTLSGGCIERTVAGEVLGAMEAGKAATLRLGAGSPLIDIRLPCGGTMDLLITPALCPNEIRKARALVRDRQPLALEFTGAGGPTFRVAEPEEVTRTQEEDGFIAIHEPNLVLKVLGNGIETERLALLAAQFGADVEVSTDQSDIADRLGGLVRQLLKTPKSPHPIRADRWTAVVLLFHDHDWEHELLLGALATEAFYIGAMGSRTTHERRLAELEANGVEPSDLKRIIGPIGLIPHAKDPDTLAVSVLADVVARRGRRPEAERHLGSPAVGLQRGGTFGQLERGSAITTYD
jgi:xanthine dehydrogenase accessory factor